MINEASEDEINSRFDLSVMREFRDTENAPVVVRKELLQSWKKDSKLSSLIPSVVFRNKYLSSIDDEKSVVNIVDYWFEPIVLSSMNIRQVRDYFKAIENRLSFRITPDLSQKAPRALLIGTIHNCRIFSVLYVLLLKLVNLHGYRKIILLHLRDPLDIRVEACGVLLNELQGVLAVSIQMQGDWLTILREEVTDKTVVICMDDMPPQITGRKNTNSKKQITLNLYNEQGTIVKAKGLNIGLVLTKRLGMQYLVLDFPAFGMAALTKYDPNNERSCPLSEWVFWPAINEYELELNHK